LVPLWDREEGFPEEWKNNLHLGVDVDIYRNNNQLVVDGGGKDVKVGVVDGPNHV
jgi:hypothetical protein